MIRILYVVLGTALNGTERYVVDLAENLPRDEFKVFIATPQKSDLSEYLKKAELEEFVFENGDKNAFSFRGLKNIYRFIREKKIDIIHSNSGILPCLIGKFSSSRISFETRHGLFYTMKQLENLPLKRKIIEKVKQYFSDFQIAISYNDKEMLKKYFGIKEEKIKVIYNGIDENKFTQYRKATGSSSEELIKLVNVGRLTFQKAQDILLESVRKLKDEFTDFHLTIIGEGEDKFKLENYIEKYSLQKYVRIEKYRKDLFEYLQNFDILVMSSRYEGVPYVMLESMAIGLPVIMTDVGGIGNVIENGVSGLIIKEGSTDELKDAILTLSKDKKLFCELQINAIVTLSKYTIKNMIENYMHLYKSTLEY
ncbi:MAG: glycosyltransferase family 4 protein [Ignavibacteriae bacterium]|nr:glycosyltransferase family 4 protein [Ignavibacteriota bacterium]